MTSGRSLKARELLERRQEILAAPVISVEDVPGILADVGLRAEWPVAPSAQERGFLYFGRIRGTAKLGFSGSVASRLETLQIRLAFLVSGAQRQHEAVLIRAFRHEAMGGSREYFDGPLFSAFLEAGARRRTTRFAEFPDAKWIVHAVRDLVSATTLEQGAA